MIYLYLIDTNISLLGVASMKMRVSSKSWCIGLLGFLGFSGISGEPSLLLFFTFFGAFQYIWLNKLGNKYDERLIENKNKAAVKGFQVALIFGLFAHIATILLFKDFEVLYRISISIFSLAFAIGLNCWAYLTYKYDRKD